VLRKGNKRKQENQLLESSKEEKLLQIEVIENLFEISNATR
jgi:hypothetical protein